MELTTEVPETKTRMKFDTDRPWDHQTGDSVMRALGVTTDGSQVFDGVYVETNPEDAKLIAYILRQSSAPTGKTRDGIAQDVQAAFGSSLSGRDAAQIAQIATRAIWLAAQRELGLPESQTDDKIQQLAERFERASAKGGVPAYATAGNGEQRTGAGTHR